MADNIERREMKLLTAQTERNKTEKPFISSVWMFIVVTLTLIPCTPIANAQAQPIDPRPSEAKFSSETYQTLYITHLTQQHDANDLLTDLRNMLPRAKLYYVSSQHAISVRATPEDIVLAQKILSDIDRARKAYRLTYTISEIEGGKRTGTQNLVLIVISGGKTELKQGSRIPVVTGTGDATSSAHNSQVQYVDVGLNIEASLDGMRLDTKIEQSSLAEEKSGVGPQDPIVRQTALEEMVTLMPGKPLVLGSLDIPGSTRHQEIEVVSELIP